MRILLADDHKIVREGIKMLLAEAYPSAILTEVSDSAELLKKAYTETWDVIISDISMPPGNSGLDAIAEIKRHTPATPVIILSMHLPEHYAKQAIKLGASAYLTKNAATLELIFAIEAVCKGNLYLTPAVLAILSDTRNSNDDEA